VASGTREPISGITRRARGGGEFHREFSKLGVIARDGIGAFNCVPAMSRGYLKMIGVSVH
jgi:hypothetical protein